MDYQGFGNGSDGVVTLSGTDAPIDSSCSGTSGQKNLGATNASFNTNKICLIHQSRGTGAGNWELNIIGSYVPGTITFQFDLVNTYTDSGASQAQVIQIPEYSAVTVSSTYTAKAWDGNVGGIIALFCSGDMDVSGTITVAGKGFRGGTGTRTGSPSQWGISGEGELGGPTGLGNTLNNGSGGGAGNYDGGNRAAGGGGGSHVSVGLTGESVGGGNFGGGYQAGVGGTGGQTILGNSDLSNICFGGGGGSSVYANGTTSVIDGGDGGGIIFIFASKLTVTGFISANGEDGIFALALGDNGGSGAGAGGSIYIQTVDGVLGSNLITSIGGISGSLNPGDNLKGEGANGANGRIAIYSCSYNGSTNPTAYQVTGGQDFCQSFIHIY